MFYFEINVLDKGCRKNTEFLCILYKASDNLEAYYK